MGSPAVQARTATVYQAYGKGQRWLTKEAAYNGAAKQLMRARCDARGDCDSEDRCFYCGSADHDGRDRWRRLRARLARWLRWRDERVAGVTPRKPNHSKIREHSAARLRAEGGVDDQPF